MSVEFSRPVRADTIGSEPRTIEVAASLEEREAIAARFDLARVDGLSASWQLHRTAAGILAEGRVQAMVVQRCVATGEDVPARVDEVTRLLFTEADAASDEIELAEDELDRLPIDGGVIDLGEASAETMALALDPYPRSPAADEALRAAGVRTEEEAVAERSPFAALRDLVGKG